MRSPRPATTLTLLTTIYGVNFIDRQLIGILSQPIKTELGLSDTQLGLLGGLAFALLYTILGLPIARLAERRRRVSIIALALAFWSAMTALTGLATGFVWLFLARIGVGVGEAGCAPPAQSLIADLFPPQRRATALATFSLGVPIGMMLSAIAGGWLASAFGWRATFALIGLPGIALALIAALVLREPARGTHDSAPALPPPPFGQVVATLAHNRAFRHMAAGASLASLAGYGLTGFAVPLMVRQGLDLRTAATGFGLVVGLALTIGIGGGGWLSDRLAARHPGAPGLLAGAGVMLAGVLFLAALSQRDPLAIALSAFAPLVAAHLYFGPTYSVTVNSVGATARATAIAILLLAMNAIGLGLGPLLVGALSDHYAVNHGPAEGLAMALRRDMLVYFWAGVHFLLAARVLRRQAQR